MLPANPLAGRRWREDYVRRAGLVRRLSQSPEASLAVIIAPPGYGKSSLISEWARHDPRPFLWLPTDELVAATVTEAAQVILATLQDTGWLDGARASVGAEPVPVEAPSPACWAALRGSSCPRSDLRARARRRSANRARGAARLVDAMVDEAPPGATFALSSRSELPIPLGRLRASRALVEVRTPDLAMIPRDGLILLRQAGLELNVDAVRQLVSLTEGWPVGLYLTALWLHEQEDPAGSVELVKGDHHLFGEYVRDEVLSDPASGAEGVRAQDIGARGVDRSALRRGVGPAELRLGAACSGAGHAAPGPARSRP